MAIVKAENIISPEGNQSVREQVNAFLEDTQTTVRHLAYVMGADEYYLNKFITGHMEVSQAFTDRLKQVI